MSGDETNKPSCLAAIFGLFILFYSIYTPMYFIFFNDEIDSFQEASLIDMIVSPIKASGGSGTQTKKFVSGLEDALSETRDRVKKATGVDMDRSLESALKKNGSISDINWTYGNARSKDSVEVIVTFNHKTYGTVAISAVVKERSFFTVTFSEFLSITTVRVGDKYYSANNIGALVAIASFYGLDDGALIEFGTALQSTGLY